MLYFSPSYHSLDTSGDRAHINPGGSPLSHHQQTGAALISTLLIFAIISILATQLITRSQTDIERTRWLINDAQGYQNTLAAEAFARSAITEKWRALRKEKLPLSAQPSPFPRFATDWGEIAIEVEDLQKKINVNTAAGAETYHRLLYHLGNEHLQSADFLPQLIDWVDLDTSPGNGGAEDSHYFAHQPLYRTGNRPMVDISEARLLSSITDKNYPQLEQLATVLPTPTAINVNAASGDVLALLDYKLSASQINNFKATNTKPFLSVQDFLQAEFTAGVVLEPSLLTTESEYFAISTTATMGDSTSALRTLVRINHKDGSLLLLNRSTAPILHINSKKTELESSHGKDPNPFF